MCLCLKSFSTEMTPICTKKHDFPMDVLSVLQIYNHHHHKLKWSGGRGGQRRQQSLWILYCVQLQISSISRILSQRLCGLLHRWHSSRFHATSNCAEVQAVSRCIWCLGEKLWRRGSGETSRCTPVTEFDHARWAHCCSQRSGGEAERPTGTGDTARMVWWGINDNDTNIVITLESLMRDHPVERPPLSEDPSFQNLSFVNNFHVNDSLTKDLS